MQPNQILTADLLDILFDGKNKEYGAYQLRRSYTRRLNTALLITSLLVTIPVILYMLPGKKEIILPPIFAPGPIVDILPPPVIEPTIKPVSAKKTKLIKTARSTTIAIVPDKNVRESDKPPVQTELDNVKIGLINQDGEPDATIEPPANEASDGNGKGVQSTSNANGNGESGNFKPVEIESEYPGGTKAWARFLNRTLGNNYPPEAFEKGIQGTVIIQFVVDIDGSVSNIEAIRGPEELHEAAIKTIRKSGKWKPAVQNNRNVKTYKKQPITFILHDEGS